MRDYLWCKGKLGFLKFFTKLLSLPLFWNLVPDPPPPPPPQKLGFDFPEHPPPHKKLKFKQILAVWVLNFQNTNTLPPPIRWQLQYVETNRCIPQGHRLVVLVGNSSLKAVLSSSTHNMPVTLNDWEWNKFAVSVQMLLVSIFIFSNICTKWKYIIFIMYFRKYRTKYGLKFCDLAKSCLIDRIVDSCFIKFILFCSLFALKHNFLRGSSEIYCFCIIHFLM